MRIARPFLAVIFVAVVIFTALPSAHAMDPYTQGLVTQMLSGLVFGAPPVPYGSTPYGPYQRPRYGSYSAPPPYSPYGLGGNGYGYAYPYKRPFDYDRAMHRLDQQEAQAMARAARRSYGNPARYNDRMAKIEHKYAYKRYTVEQNASYCGYGYR